MYYGFLIKRFYNILLCNDSYFKKKSTFAKNAKNNNKITMNCYT